MAIRAPDGANKIVHMCIHLWDIIYLYKIVHKIRLALWLPHWIYLEFEEEDWSLDQIRYNLSLPALLMSFLVNFVKLNFNQVSQFQTLNTCVPATYIISIHAAFNTLEKLWTTLQFVFKWYATFPNTEVFYCMGL